MKWNCNNNLVSIFLIILVIYSILKYLQSEYVVLCVYKNCKNDSTVIWDAVQIPLYNAVQDAIAK